MRSLTLAWLACLAVISAWDARGIITYPILLGGLVISMATLWLSDLAGAWIARRKEIPSRIWFVLVTLTVVSMPAWGAWLCFRTPSLRPGLALSAVAIALGLALSWAVNRLLPPLFRLTFLLALIQLTGLFVAANLSEGTLVAVRDDTALMHLGVFYGLLSASYLLALGWMLRVAEVSENPVGVRRGQWVRIALGVATAAMGLGLLVADRRLFSGLYPGLHDWMLFVGLGSVAAFIVRPARTLLDRLRPSPSWTTAVLLAIPAAACIWLLASSHPADPFIRASLEQSRVAPLALRFRQGTALGEGLERKNLSLLDYPRHHDFEHDLPRQNILLLTVDALRADYLGPGATWSGHAPVLDELISQGAWFPRTYTTGPRTAIAMSGILLARYSAEIKWNLFIWRRGKVYDPNTIDEKTRREIGGKWVHTTIPDFPAGGTIAKRLQDVGYHTIGIPYVKGDAFFERGLGFEQGFDVYHNLGRIRGRNTSAKVLQLALDELDRAPRGKPWFLWVHLFDVHDAGVDRRVYAEVLESTDREIGEFLDKRGVWDDTMLVLMSDHGQAMEEHGLSYHGTGLYDEQVGVPMIIRLPGAKPRALDAPTSVLDGSATILSLARADASGTDGVNLLPFILAGEYPRNRPVFTEIHRYLGQTGVPTLDAKGVVLGDFKLIHNRMDQWVKLFNLADDPAEEINLARKNPGEARRLLELLVSWINPRERANPLPGTHSDP